MRIVFITGGARSGKSAYALAQAHKISGKKAFIATAQALDDEMKERIEAHKRHRANVWDTYEEPIRIAGLVQDLKHRYDVIIIDCLSIWLSNVMLAEMDVMKEIERLIEAIIQQHTQATPMKGLSYEVDSDHNNQSTHTKHGYVYSNTESSPLGAIFIVSNEVGMGIVPENKVARQFRDYQGVLNQHIAGIADEVYLMVSGIPMRVR